MDTAKTASILTLLALLCSGCGSSPQLLISHTFLVKTSVTDAQLEIAHQVGDELCEMSGGQSCFDFSRDAVDTKNTFSVSPLSGNLLGRIYWTDDHARIVLEDDPDFTMTLRHELGHAAGCWMHVDDPKSVMYAFSGYQGLWTDLDLQCIRENWDLLDKIKQQLGEDTDIIVE
jgi:hypothetical protein